jgi:hypothetical protein
VAGEPEGADEVENGIAFAQSQHLECGFADGLDDNGDSSLLNAEIRHSQGDSLAMLIDAGHDEMAGASGARHIGRFDVPEEGRGTEEFPAGDEKHYTPPKEHSSRFSEGKL